MKTKTKIVIFFICVSLFSSLHGQIRSDFVLSPVGKTPCIRIDREGKLHATWWSGGSVYYGLFDSLGHAIQTSQRISNSDFTESPRLAIGKDYAVVIWRQRSLTFNSYIIGQLITISGDTTFENIRFNDVYFDAERFSPDVMYLNDSTFFVVWAGNGPETPSPATGIYGQIATNSLRAIGINRLLSDDTPENSTHTFGRIATNLKSETAVVVWLDGSSRGNKVFGRLFSKDGTPLGSTFLISDDPDISYAWSPGVVMNGNGDFIVAWSCEIKNRGWNVYQRRFHADGSPLGPSERISQGEAAYAAAVDISMDGDATVVIVWEGQGSSGLYITAQRFAANGTTIGNNFTVGITSDTVDQYYPSVVLHNGKIYTAWQAEGTIWANIIDFNNPPVSVEGRTTGIPRSFHLFQNYPNPCNPTTTIKYEIPRRSHVRLVIYNLLGEEIVTLENNEVLPGIHEVQWDGKDSKGGDVSSGIYLYRLSVNGYAQTRKMVLTR